MGEFDWPPKAQAAALWRIAQIREERQEASNLDQIESMRATLSELKADVQERDEVFERWKTMTFGEWLDG